MKKRGACDVRPIKAVAPPKENAGDAVVVAEEAARSFGGSM